ncbi:DUF4433 domain-containing protein [Chitinimonas lacunae]|uniref:DUF4433 domain-containing protein n=1 Tax=Chitinimonas lacunae TaxID=1963018 RepID=A0ABV8MPA0_9NEIS
MTTPPSPLWLYRLVPLGQLAPLLRRGGLHAPAHQPEDGLTLPSFDPAVARPAGRRQFAVPGARGGSSDDYLGFDFGPAPPALATFIQDAPPDGADSPILIYLLTTLQVLTDKRIEFVFSDGDPAVGYTDWYDDPARLDRIDWDAVKTPPWESPADDDQRRRKQARLLVWQSLPWALIRGIAVPDGDIGYQVESLLARYPRRAQPKVVVRPGWYRP